MTIVYADEHLTLHHGDCRDVMRHLAADSVDCVVTSPPYWGLRDYGLPPAAWGGDPEHEHAWGAMERGKRKDIKPLDETTSTGRIGSGDRQSQAALNGGRFCACGAWLGCLGLEPDPFLFVAHLVDVFREIRRVLRPTGTAWLNLGDSFASHDPGDRRDGEFLNPNGVQSDKGRRSGPAVRNRAGNYAVAGLKPKDLVGVPWMAAFALRDDGWWLRRDIVWSKPNPMPESTTDRPTSAHEYVFLLAKSRRYHYDADAIAEPATHANEARWDPGTDGLGGSDRRTGASTRRFRDRRPAGWSDSDDRSAVGRCVHKRPSGWNAGDTAADRIGRYKTAETPHAHGRRQAPEPGEAGAFTVIDGQLRRNKRSVWTVATQPYRGAHFATFPTELVRPMVRAGCPPDGIVLDPFAGTGTVGLVAQQEGRLAVLIDLNPDYLRQCLARTAREWGVGGRILEDRERDALDGPLWAALG